MQQPAKSNVQQGPGSPLSDIDTIRRHACATQASGRDADPDKKPDKPEREVPNPAVPPDMEPVVPQQDPQPGRPGDGQPPPIIASWRQ